MGFRKGVRVRWEGQERGRGAQRTYLLYVLTPYSLLDVLTSFFSSLTYVRLGYVYAGSLRFRSGKSPALQPREAPLLVCVCVCVCASAFFHSIPWPEK